MSIRGIGGAKQGNWRIAGFRVREFGDRIIRRPIVTDSEGLRSSTEYYYKVGVFGNLQSKR